MKKNPKWLFSAWHCWSRIMFGMDWCYSRHSGLTEIDFFFLFWGFGWVKYFQPRGKK